MTLPDATDEDVQEQQTSLLEEPPTVVDDLPEDATEADVADQRREVTLDEEDAPIG